jgi:Uma2 family endonuclease
MSDNKELITAQVLAEALNLSVETVWRYTREDKIPYIMLGSKNYRYRLADVMRSLTEPTLQENTVEYKEEGANNKFTYKDYLLLPEELGYRYEILKGILIKEPSPNVIHQRVSRRLQRILEDYFWKIDPEGEVFDAPLDVTFNDITVVQPDLFYVPGEQKVIVKDSRIDGSPTLIVEVLSPSSSRKDRLQKLKIYQEAQVEHYWLVNPQEKTLECFSLQNGIYALVTAGLDEEIVEHPEFTGLSIALGDLW